MHDAISSTDIIQPKWQGAYPLKLIAVLLYISFNSQKLILKVDIFHFTLCSELLGTPKDAS